MLERIGAAIADKRANIHIIMTTEQAGTEGRRII